MDCGLQPWHGDASAKQDRGGPKPCSDPCNPACCVYVKLRIALTDRATGGLNVMS
jgi:hypothetical protein